MSFGLLTTVINLLSFYILITLAIEYKIATLIASAISIVFAFFTNRIYVFQSKSMAKIGIFKEFTRFFLARVLTLFIDFISMIFFIEICDIGEVIGKIITNIIVIILNYIISEFFVFNTKK